VAKHKSVLSTSRPVLATKYGALYHCDCLLLMKRMRKESIDCIFADPPFNLGKDYRNGQTDDLSRIEYLQWSYDWIDECVRLLANGGALFIYCLPKWAYLFASHLDPKLEFRHWIAVTMKSTYRRGRRLYPAHYAILYFTKGKPKVFNRLRIPIPKCRKCDAEIRDYGGHRKYLNSRGLNLSDFWDDTSPVRHKKHKFRKLNELKPVIPKRCIGLSTRKRAIVFDPFGGGGSTYEAAESLNRFWIGCELADCRPIIRRMQTHLMVSPRKRIPPSVAHLLRST
jgi:site-specific DNA-methyltransferase (adenine-specific)